MGVVAAADPDRESRHRPAAETARRTSGGAHSSALTRHDARAAAAPPRRCVTGEGRLTRTSNGSGHVDCCGRRPRRGRGAEQAAATTHGARHGGARGERGPRAARAPARGVGVSGAQRRARTRRRSWQPRASSAAAGRGGGGVPFVASAIASARPTDCWRSARVQPSGPSVDGQRLGPWASHTSSPVPRCRLRPQQRRAPCAAAALVSPEGRLGSPSPPRSARGARRGVAVDVAAARGRLGW